MQLRPYQADLLAGIRHVWAREGTPLAVLATGGGKTVVFARALREHDGPAVAIAHRKELVGQISLALAREGVWHKIIAPRETIRMIVRNNVDEIGESFFDPNADVAVAGVDSIRNSSEQWRRAVTLWVTDEGHHLLCANKWGRAVALLPNAKGLGVTATPERADGKGLGAHCDGVYTDIVEGPPMRDLIDRGFLSDYRIYAPENSMDLSTVGVSSATGDFNAPQLRTAMDKAKITGDVVAHYRKYAEGMLGVTFAVSVKAAVEIADSFRAAGIPALAIDAKTPAKDRADALRRFRHREILQLVNVDLFGEGFDLPAIQAVSFARPTMSFPLYAQSFGRALRIMEGKDDAVIIDHVGNVVRHRGPPDVPRIHSLNRQKRRSKNDVDPLGLRACPACARVFKRITVVCPYCQHVPAPTQRSAPKHVDGDLVELDARTLAFMRGAVNRVDQCLVEYAAQLRGRHCPEIGIAAHVKRHKATQVSQARLRHILDWWRGCKHREGYSERESFRLFFLSYGIDVLSARALPSKDADVLYERVRLSLPFAAQCMS